jgi:tetratricopeptide (TPR) repeat protein
MKKLLIINALCFVISALYAQDNAKLKIPEPSPEVAFTQQLGTTEIQVAYARPLVKGRKIFGELVPFDSLWRTGAADCTTLKFNEDLTIGDKKLKAGKYALFTIPKADEWTIIINADTALHGAYGYDVQKDVHRFTVKSQKIGHFYEAFTIDFNEINLKGEGFLNLLWENTLVKIPVKSPSNDNIIAEITKRLVENKEQNADLMFQAANYYYSTNQNLRQAADFTLAAEKLDEAKVNYPNLAQKILADLKDYRPAIEAAQRAIVLYEKKNNTVAIATMKKRVAEWQTILGEKPTADVVSRVSDALKEPKSETQNPKPETQNPKNTVPPSWDDDKSVKGGKTVELKAQFAPVLSAYYGLKDALVGDNSKTAASNAKTLKAALANIDTKDWTAKQRKEYETLTKKLETDAQHIADNGTKIDQQREHLETLSNNLFTITKSLKINSEPAYLQFCPMANDGKGAYWLSKENKVKNPYYGKSMLTCGSVKETLK